MDLCRLLYLFVDDVYPLEINVLLLSVIANCE
jgi:hypothetical protein